MITPEGSEGGDTVNTSTHWHARDSSQGLLEVLVNNQLITFLIVLQTRGRLIVSVNRESQHTRTGATTERARLVRTGVQGSGFVIQFSPGIPVAAVVILRVYIPFPRPTLDGPLIRASAFRDDR